MKIAFHFEGGNAQVILIPESNRDEQCLTLATEDKPTIRVKPTTDRVLILEFTDGQSNHSN